MDISQTEIADSHRDPAWHREDAHDSARSTRLRELIEPEEGSGDRRAESSPHYYVLGELSRSELREAER